MLRLEFERRVVRRISLEKFASLAHIPKPHLRLMESGRLVPTDVELQLLAQALEVSPSELLTPIRIGWLPVEADEKQPVGQTA